MTPLCSIVGRCGTTLGGCNNNGLFDPMIGLHISSGTLVGPLGRCVRTTDHATIFVFVLVAFWERLYNDLQ